MTPSNSSSMVSFSGIIKGNSPGSLNKTIDRLVSVTKSEEIADILHSGANLAMELGIPAGAVLLLVLVLILLHFWALSKWGREGYRLRIHLWRKRIGLQRQGQRLGGRPATVPLRRFLNFSSSSDNSEIESPLRRRLQNFLNNLRYVMGSPQEFPGASSSTRSDSSGDVALTAADMAAQQALRALWPEVGTSSTVNQVPLSAPAPLSRVEQQRRQHVQNMHDCAEWQRQHQNASGSSFDESFELDYSVLSPVVPQPTGFRVVPSDQPFGGVVPEIVIHSPPNPPFAAIDIMSPEQQEQLDEVFLRRSTRVRCPTDRLTYNTLGNPTNSVSGNERHPSTENENVLK